MAPAGADPLAGGLAPFDELAHPVLPQAVEGPFGGSLNQLRARRIAGMWDIHAPEDLQKIRPNVIAVLSRYFANSRPCKGASVVALLR
eukprot:6505374-Pyramimonas_sp.AAC.1